VKAVKRWLYLLHRWFGIVMCLLIALWFATGIIMMYVEYPELTEQERLARLPALPWQQVRLQASDAAALLTGALQEPASVKLTSVLGRPAYQFSSAFGEYFTVFADDGSLLQGLTPAQAQQAALAGTDASAQARHLGLMDMDQWTVSSGLSPYRPLHKVALGDQAGSIVYVSEVTGQVVRDSTRNERFWNWLGSTIHWIYPWQLRRNATLWADIVIWLSLAGLVSVVTGGIIGFLRLRLRKPYQGDRYTPYRGWQKWHHVLGLGSLLFLFSFMFSGLMSMSPWGVFDNQSSAAPALARYNGATLATLADFPGQDALAAAALLTQAAASQQSTHAPLKEVQWTRLGGEGLLVLALGNGSRRVLSHAGLLDRDALLQRVAAAAPSLLPEATLLHSERLDHEDNYYYSHHNRYRPLPVLRLRFDDAEASWFHVDLASGQLLGRLTATDRVARWLYNGLHSLDFRPLFPYRPLWDLIVILLCLAGLTFSVTSIWLGWRRLWH